MKKHYEENKKNSLFYDDRDIVVEKKLEENKTLLLVASGEKRVIYKGEALVSGKDFSKAFENDSELEKAEESEDWEMWNNNWFEIVLHKNGESRYFEDCITIEEFEKIVSNPNRLNEILSYLEN